MSVTPNSRSSQRIFWSILDRSCRKAGPFRVATQVPFRTMKSILPVSCIIPIHQPKSCIIPMAEVVCAIEDPNRHHTRQPASSPPSPFSHPSSPRALRCVRYKILTDITTRHPSKRPHNSEQTLTIPKRSIYETSSTFQSRNVCSRETFAVAFKLRKVEVL